MDIINIQLEKVNETYSLVYEMQLVIAMVLSIAIKAVSAIVEIVIQMLITNVVGVSEYGNYTFFVSIIEGAYFVLFSGSIKLNTFYLSTPSSSLNTFKKKYLLYFVTPIILVIILLFSILKNPFGILAGIVLYIFYFAYDYSSIFFSRGYQLPALLGEYLFGRIMLLIAILVTIKIDALSVFVLCALYGLQFITMLMWFIPNKKRLNKGTSEVQVPLRKLIEYQISDIANSLISYSPTILQFIFGGAFTAGFTGIVSIVKKFINFISGPTAKVFLPEFSRLYKSGDRDKLKQSYVMIVRIQMVFIGTIGALLIGFPELILSLFSPELEQYSNVFTLSAICLLVVAGIGPVIGLLQMTGNERICNYNQWISIGMMVIFWVVLRNNLLFAVYGLCIQAVIESGLNYYSVCKWFGRNIIPVFNYIMLWFPVLVERLLVFIFALQNSYLACFFSIAFVFIWNVGFALRDPMIRKTIFEIIALKK